MMNHSDGLQDIDAEVKGKETDFAERLRTLVAIAPSKSAFARMIGISPITLWTYLGPKHSSPSLPIIRKIATRLGIDPNWLAFGRGPAPNVAKIAGQIAERLAAERQGSERVA
jgi:transcriptional regulator with XRE-family HTH domain